MLEHLTDAQLTALAKGELSAEEASRANEHLRSCPDCYALSIRGAESDTGDVDSETGAIVGRPSWLDNAPPDVAWPAGTDLGRYVILHTLGKGGMGVVFRAYDKELDRAVALKVLRQDDGDSATDGPAKLLREAQAMARLSHPNVVAVHDVVVLEKRVCVVMELVEGTNVREWLKAEPKKSWKEILSVFRAAAEGLAAAHDAHLVHRDFKPDNVLVGKDARIRVTDFGIARLAGDSSAGPVLPPTVNLGEHTLGRTLGETTENQLLGTPRYMAPEQFEKAPAGFVTDQFSFGVALYEALYGEHPFKGDTLPARVRAARQGEIRPQPAASNVPPWVFRIVSQCLAADPQKRFASMREVNAALSRDPTQVRNRWLVGGGFAAALGLATIVVVNSVQARAQLCTGSELKLNGVWDDARREQIHQAFTATNLPFAEDSFTRAAAVLDAYTSQWVTTHREACEATSVRGEQSDSILTLRMACLHQRLDAVTAMTDLFTRADPGIVGKAKQALDSLPQLSTCSDVARLSAKLPPPEDPKVAAEVERIRTDITRQRVTYDAGRYEEADKMARAALEAAKKTGYAPLIAEAEVRVGLAQGKLDRYDEARDVYTSAFTHALGEGHDEAGTEAAMQLAETFFRRHQNDAALEWANFAQASHKRSGDPEAGALIHNVRGNIARNVGDFEGAIAHYLRASEEAKNKLGPDHMTTIGTTYNLASALQNLGRYREAVALFDPLIENSRRTLGPRHPFVAFPLASYATAAAARGDNATAKKLFEEVLVVTGGKGRNADNAYDALAEIALEEKRYDDALEYVERALGVHAVLSPGGPEALGSLLARARVFLAQGKDAEAETILEDVLARGAGKDGAYDAVAGAKLTKATLLFARGRSEQALTLAADAAKALAGKRGRHPDTFEARLLVADLRWSLGEKAEAVREAEAVLADARVELTEDHELVSRARALSTRTSAEASSIR